MISTDRPDFEAQLAVLFGGFQGFLTPPRVEAFWRGLQKMPLSTFVRCVDQALGENGSDKLPTVSTIWQISNTLRAYHAPTRPAEEFDTFHAWGGRCLLTFLRQRNGVPDSAVPKLVEIKNRIVGNLKNSSKPSIDDIDVKEWRELMFSAFDSALKAEAA